MTDIHYLGLEFLPWLQSFEQLAGIAAFLAIFVKVEYVISFMIPAVCYFYSPRIGMAIFLLIGFDTAIGEALRILLAQPRPWWVLQELLPIDRVDSIYSSPAGYASFSLIIVGYLYKQINKYRVLVIGMSFSLLCCIAKMYEAAAMPTHILLGYLQGLVTLALFLKYEKTLTKFILSPSMLRSLLFLVGFVSVLYLINVLAFVVHEFYVLPEEWTRYRVLPSVRLSKGGAILLLGMFTGCYLAMRQNYNLMADIKKWHLGRRTLAFIIGAAGYIFFMIVLRGMMTGGENRVANGALNFIFATVAAYWWFFVPPRFLQRKTEDHEHQALINQSTH